MSPGDRPLADTAVSAEDLPEPERPRVEYWPPRPSTVVAALVVGASLIWMNLDRVGRDFAMYFAERYGWPFSYRLTVSQDPGPSGALFAAAAMAADLVVWAALLASACATTQIAAYLLVRSPRLNVRHLGLWVFTIALFLAGCRLKEGFLIHSFLVGFYYGLASLIVLGACLLLRLELPIRETTRRGG